MYNRKKKTTSVEYYLKNIKYNLRRLSRYIIRGKFNKAFFPGMYEDKNNFQKIALFGRHMVDSILLNTLNTTLTDLGTTAKNLPKEFAKRLICFKPTIIRFIRVRQAKAKEQQFMNKMKSIRKYKASLRYI